jgi:hypothetical protein
MAAWRKMGYRYPSGLEKTLCKWEIYVPLVTKGLTCPAVGVEYCFHLIQNPSYFVISDSLGINFSLQATSILYRTILHPQRMHIQFNVREIQTPVFGKQLSSRMP